MIKISIKKLIAPLLIITMMIPNALCVQPIVIYYQNFNEYDETFTSPELSEDLAYENKSAKIPVNGLTMKSINVNVSADINLDIEIQFKWRFNLQKNYSIGIIFNSTLNKRENILTGILLSLNASNSLYGLLIPQLVNKFYNESNFYYKSEINEWNDFTISNIRDLILYSSTIQNEIDFITLNTITFFLYSIESNQTGYLMVDELKLSTYIEESPNKVTDVTYYIIIVIIIIVSVVSVVLIQRRIK